MSDERIASILVAPLMSEKASLLAENAGQYTFKVVVNATKIEIKKAVAAMFKVDVVSVQTVTCHGKARRVGRRMGRTKQWKKAYVQLAEGQEIDFATKEVA